MADSDEKVFKVKEMKVDLLGFQEIQRMGIELKRKVQEIRDSFRRQKREIIELKTGHKMVNSYTQPDNFIFNMEDHIKAYNGYEILEKKLKDLKKEINKQKSENQTMDGKMKKKI